MLRRSSIMQNPFTEGIYLTPSATWQCVIKKCAGGE